MKPPDNEALSQTLREMARTTSPDELAKRGVKRVRSIKLEEITLLIERAVGRTMLARTMNVDRDELERLVGQARAEWKRLLTSHQQLSGSRARLGEHRAELEDELAELRDQTSSLSSTDADEDARLERLLREGTAPDAVVSGALDLVRESRAKERAVHADREALLERRVDKLLESLGQTEEVLRRLAEQRTLDVGLPSLYRVVQGLSDAEENVELKKELMGAIFAANRGLQDTLRAGQGSDADTPPEPDPEAP